jgi:hypothetical protein
MNEETSDVIQTSLSLSYVFAQLGKLFFVFADPLRRLRSKGPAHLVGGGRDRRRIARLAGISAA